MKNKNFNPNQLKVYKYSFCGVFFRFSGFYAVLSVILIIVLAGKLDPKNIEYPKTFLCIFYIFGICAAIIHYIIHPVVGIGTDGLYVKSFNKFNKIEWKHIRMYKRPKKSQWTRSALQNEPRIVYIITKYHGIFRKVIILSAFIKEYHELINTIERNLIESSSEVRFL